jgi:hypothetical protein
MSRGTLAAATAVLIFVALLFGYVLDVTNNEEGDSDVVGWLIVSAVASFSRSRSGCRHWRWRQRAALALRRRVTAGRPPPRRPSRRSRSWSRSSSVSWADRAR